MFFNFKKYNNNLLLLFFICISFFFFTKVIYSGTISEGGHSSITGSERGKATKSIPEIFVSKSITGTSTYSYNSVGSSTINDGWFDTRGYKKISIALYVPVYNSGTVTFRIESLTGSSTLNSEIITKNYTAVQTIGDLISVSEGANKMRVGAIISSATGSGSVSASAYLEE